MRAVRLKLMVADATSDQNLRQELLGAGPWRARRAGVHNEQSDSCPARAKTVLGRANLTKPSHSTGRRQRTRHRRATIRTLQHGSSRRVTSSARQSPHTDVIALKGASYRIKHTAIESLPSVEADRQADSTP